MNQLRPMLTVASRHGIYNGPYVQAAPVIIRTDYMGNLYYPVLQSILRQNGVVPPDFEIVKIEDRLDDRDIYLVAMYPGMVFHGRN